MVVHDLFLENTAAFSDWRVVSIQESVIESVVKSANSLQEVAENPLLISWFEQLTRKTEAQMCIHYMFR